MRRCHFGNARGVHAEVEECVQTVDADVDGLVGEDDNEELHHVEVDELSPRSRTGAEVLQALGGDHVASFHSGYASLLNDCK